MFTVTLPGGLVCRSGNRLRSVPAVVVAAIVLGGFSSAKAATIFTEDFSGYWAIMFYRNHTITLTSGIAGDSSGSNYFVDFDYGTASYAGASQNTAASDGLIVQILRGDDSILAQQTYLPGAWGAGNRNLEAVLQGTLAHVSDGTGDVRLFARTVNDAADRFGGAMANIVWSDSMAPEPGSSMLLGVGLAGLVWSGRRRGQRRAGSR